MKPLLRRQKEAIVEMFSAIAPRYDLLNRLLSAWQDVRWRRFAVEWLPVDAQVIVDIGTGTGDFAFMALERCPFAKVVGVDPSPTMLRLAYKKAERKGVSDRTQWVQGDGLQLPMRDEIADVVLCAFVIRNFADLSQGLRELARILRPNGVALILEFCQPPSDWWLTPIGVFVRFGVPLLGRILSDPIAYAYLTASIRTFLPAEQIAALLCQQGFRKVHWLPLTFGVATLFWARK